MALGEISDKIIGREGVGVQSITELRSRL